MRTVYSSRRPRSMRRESTHSVPDGSVAYVSEGPTAPKDGPTLPSAEIVAPTAVRESKPRRLNARTPATRQNRYRIMNPLTLARTSADTGLPSTLYTKTARGWRSFRMVIRASLAMMMCRRTLIDPEVRSEERRVGEEQDAREEP